MSTTDFNQGRRRHPAPRRRLVQISALSITAALALSACGGDAEADGETNGNGSEANGSSGEAPASLSVTTFNEFGYEELFEEYEELTGIQIEHNKVDTAENARDSLRNSLGAGSGASDIEAVELDWLVEFMQYSDRFEDLSEDAPAERWLDWKYEDAVDEEGRVIGFGTDIGPQALCYRADLFEEAGLPADREEVAAALEGDWENYFELGREFVAESESAWYSGSDNIWQGMINQVEVPFETEEGEIIANTNPEVKDLYDQLLTASVEDELSAGLSQWSGDWTDAFQRDGFATMLCPGWMLGVIEGNADGVDGWDVADAFPGGGGNWGGSYLTVPTQGENVEAAKELAAWLTEPEQQIKAFEAIGAFPSTLEALESDEIQAATDEFFNDAPVGEILASRAEAIEVQPFKGPNYLLINVAIQDALNRVDADGIDDAETSWEKFLNDVEAMN